MQALLIMLYALLSLNTAQIRAIEETGEGMDEMERLIQTGDDIRVEIQSIRSNF